MRSEHGRLTLEAKDRAIDVWLPCKHADVVRQITGGKVIRAVHDHVVVSHDLLRVVAGEATFVQFEFDLRINIPQPVTRRCKFAAADVLCSVKNLPLQIGEVDTVEIDKPESSHTSCCQIQRSRGAQTTGANAQNTRGLKSFLSLSSHFGHDEVSRIALQ